MTIYECSLYDFDGFCQWYFRDGSKRFVIANNIEEVKKKYCKNMDVRINSKSVKISEFKQSKIKTINGFEVL